MTELTTEEQCGWVRDTLCSIAALPTLNDDDFAYVVFEELDADVHSCLHTVSLDRLVDAGYMTKEIECKLFTIRGQFLAWVDSHRLVPIELIRRSEFIKSVSVECSRLLAAYNLNRS